MKISKSIFTEYSRCKRYAPLDEVRLKKLKSIVEIDDIITIENKEKLKDFINDMYDEDTEESLIDKVDEKQEIMLPFYNKIEELSAKKVKHMFGEQVHFSMNTKNQKSFTYQYNDYEFYCFLDGYQEINGNINIFESKATTDKKFLDKAYTVNKVTYPIFSYSPSGILMLNEQLNIENLDDLKYEQQKSKLYDRYTDVGKYVYDLAYQRFVIEGYFKSINKPEQLNNIKYYLAVLNSEYVFDGKYENNTPVYDNNIISLIDLTIITKDMQDVIKEDIDKVVEYLDTMDMNKCKLGIHCQRKKIRECKFTKICYKDFPEVSSIFAYMSASFGFKDKKTNTKYSLFELINDYHYYKMTDVPYDFLERDNNIIQRNVVDNNEVYIDKEKIRDGLNLLRYPIYHLDFESFACPLPRYYKEKAYSQSLFQYSLHIERSKGVCDKNNDHYEYLAKDHNDHRRDLIESLLNNIKDDNGSIMVYNIAFEKTRLKELSLLYPDLSIEINKLINRLFDLMHIIKNNKDLYKSLGYDTKRASQINYYHEKLNGSFSIKKVLPLFSNLKYSDLEVQNGNEAMVTYFKFPTLDKKEFNEQYNNLLEYCKQDTWAMFEILNNLYKIVDN